MLPRVDHPPSGNLARGLIEEFEKRQRRAKSIAWDDTGANMQMCKAQEET